jgi:hypothetical protein
VKQYFTPYPDPDFILQFRHEGKTKTSVSEEQIPDLIEFSQHKYPKIKEILEKALALMKAKQEGEILLENY